MARRSVTLSMTSDDYDVIHVTSQSSKSSHSESRTRTDCPHESFIIEHCVKNQLIRLRTPGEQAFGVTLPQVKIAVPLLFDGDEWVA